MRFLGYGAAAILLFSFSVSSVFATTGIISSDPVHAQQFSFYCGPYVQSFESNKHYIVNDTTCLYSIPNTISGNKIVTLYKGTPGVGATQVGGDLVSHGGTLISQTPNVFGSPQNEDDYFAVVYDFSLDQTPQPFKDYLSGATSTIPTGVVEGQNFFIIPWKWGPKPPEEFDPVIIIPGILGSWEKDGGLILDPLTHTYDNLTDTLLTNGYVQDKTLFTFPYDWRKSNVETAQLLGSRIQDIKEMCDCSYVDVLAHSMGGLVASQYIGNDSYENDIDQIVFLGTPIAGAPAAYPLWESGEVDFGNPLENLIMQQVFKREALDAGFFSVLSYLQSGEVPSVQELLPVYDYLSDTNGLRAYPDGYPQNIFLENLHKSAPAKFISSTRSYVVVGNTGGTSTPVGFTVGPSTQPPKWEHGEPLATEWGEGDDTVPHFSSLFFFGPEKEFTGINHTALVEASASYVFETLNSKAPETVTANEYGFFQRDYGVLIDKLFPTSTDLEDLMLMVVDMLPLDPTADTILKILVIVLYSPVDVEVTAPDGKKVGKDIATGGVVNDIPNTLYSGPVEEREYVIIFNPLPGEYRVTTKGTGSGTYTIGAGFADRATTSVSFVSGTTTLNQVIENAMLLSSTSTTITIQEDTPPPPSPNEAITPETCVKDVQLAYKSKWITKKSVYNALVADCKLLGVLFEVRDKAKRDSVRKGTVAAIKLVLDHMDKLAKDKGNTKEAVELIIKNTVWFRAHEL